MAEVKASHLLIKHSGSRRPASWKDPDGKIIRQTSKEAAIDKLLQLRGDIVNGNASFEDLARQYSDCSSAKYGGDLGEWS